MRTRFYVILYIIIIFLLSANLPVYGAYQPTVSSTIINTVSNPVPVNIVSGTVSVNTTGLATSTNQTSGGQKTQITNASGTPVAIRALGSQVVSGDVSIVTQSVIHGLTTAGGGSFVDVKVNPSGALETSGTFTINGVPTVNQGTSPWIVSGTVGLTPNQSVSVTNFPGLYNGSITGVSTTAQLPISISAVSTTGVLGTSIQGVSTTANFNGSITGVSTTTALPISAVSLPLPTGAATLSEQQTQTTHLSAIETATEAIQGNNFNQLLDINTSVNTLLKPASTLSAVTTVGTITNAVTVNQGTSPWLVSGTIALNPNQSVSASVTNFPTVYNGAITGVSTTDVIRANIQGVSTTVNVAVTSVSTTGVFNTSLVGVSTTSVLRANLQGVSTTDVVRVNIQAVSTTGIFSVSQTNMIPNFTTAATVSASLSGNYAFAVLVTNANRKGAQIDNSTDNTCWVKFGTAPTSASYSVRLIPGASYSMDYPIYTGAINGICSASATTGVLMTTEQ